MSARASGGAAAGRRATRGKKVEEVAPVIVEPPPKTEQELIEEQLAATLLSIPAAAPPPPAPSPTDVLWRVSAAEIARFCFPPGEQHPRSRARLWLLATQGPLVRRHTYLACLCPTCQLAVRERRKEDEYCARIFAGKRFTERNVPKGRRAETAASSDSHSANDAAPARTRPSVPALSGVNAAASTSSPASPAPLSITLPAQGLATASSTPFASPSAAAAASPSAALVSTAVLRSAASSISPAAASSDQLPFLCRSCSAHARTCAHLLSGAGGSHVLTSLEVGELARRLDEEDLLRAYNRLGPGAGKNSRLQGSEEREFIAKIDGEKRARARLDYTPEQLTQLLAPLARIRDEQSGGETDLIDFYALRELVLSERRTRIDRLGQMYPDAATKGSKDDLQSAAITLKHQHKDPTLQRRSAHPQKSRAGVQRRGGEEEAKEQAPRDNVNGVEWPGESMLTYSLLARKFAPHQSGALRTALLHKHSHQVVELGPGVDSPSVQLSVALMRNTTLNDKTEGWKTHF